MSGYVLLILKDEDTQKVRSLFRADETTELSLPKNRTMLCVTTSGALKRQSAFQSNRFSFFQGYGIDHEGETMVFSGAASKHVPDPSKPLEGSYVVAKVERKQVRIGADLFGFVPMLWFSEGGVTAVSDSYLTLIQIRKTLGMACRVDQETVVGRMWLNTMNSQQLGRETYCREIKYAIPGTELRFHYSNGALEERPLNLKSFFFSFAESHRDAVTNAATRMIRTLKTYAATGARIEFALSGGHDSRLCLAVAMSAGIQDSLSITSAPAQTADFAVATMLSEQIGFPLNEGGGASGRVQRIDATAWWAASSMGIYDVLYMPGSFGYGAEPLFSVGGHGAESAKGGYAWMPIGEIPMPEAALQQAKRALQAMGVDPEDEWGSEWHYLAFRTAIHGGRGILASDYVSRIAVQAPLIGLSRSAVNEFPAPKRGKPSIIHDVLIVLQPEIAGYRYDSPSKGLSQAFISSRLQALGGKLATGHLQPYRIIGSPSSPPGLLRSQVDIAQSQGFTGGMSAANLLEKATVSADVFADLIPTDIRSELNALSPEDASRIPASSKGAAVLGKLLALFPLL